MNKILIFFCIGSMVAITIFILVFFLVDEIKTNRAEKKLIEKNKAQNNKEVEVKKENEKNEKELVKDNIDSLNAAFDLMHNTSKKGQERNGK